MKLLLVFHFLFACFLNAQYLDFISYKKIQKLVQKEEQIAKAYKEYVLKNALDPNLDDLITDGFLPIGFDKTDSFGNNLFLYGNLSGQRNSAKSLDFSQHQFKSHILDYYYSNKNREYTSAPLSIYNPYVKFKLSIKEQYFLDFKDVITTDENLAKDKYYLDENSNLHWKDTAGDTLFILNKDLNIIVPTGVSIVDQANETIYSSFLSTFNTNNVLFTGQYIFEENNEYIYLGERVGVKKINVSLDEDTKTILQMGRYSGSALINGDIFTWGNNTNKTLAINNEDFNKEDGSLEIQKKMHINIPLKAKVKTYNTLIDDNKWFSSPLRVKFSDVFSSSNHSTCAVSVNNELFCSGFDVLENNYIEFDSYTRTSLDNIHILYKSIFFDGTTNKINKVFALKNTYLSLANATKDDENSFIDGEIYYWGREHTSAYNGQGIKSEVNITSPSKITIIDNSLEVKFKDIVYTKMPGYHKIAALSNDGDIYIWGMDEEINTNTNSNDDNHCIQTVESIPFDYCTPTKILNPIPFVSIRASQSAFIAKDTKGEFYKITQPKDSLVIIDNITNQIKSHASYDQVSDNEILYVDISRELISGNLSSNLDYGIVWVNKDYELKGDFYTASNESDTIFNEAIDTIKWIKIYVLDHENSMCGIDINKQLYCWGNMSVYSSDSINKNSINLPLFNTNLYDLQTDYLLMSAKEDDITQITSGEWTTSDSKKPFFIKYPTFIGGFNYDFTLK